MFHARGNSILALIRNRYIFAMGGQTNIQQHLSEVEVYDTKYD